MAQSKYKQFNKEEFNSTFRQSSVYKQLANDYPKLVLDVNDITSVDDDPTVYRMPRQALAEQGIFTYGMFYYLNMLLEKNPSTIMDIGCGENPYKKYIPQLLGVDPLFPAADIRDQFDNQFVEKHLGEYDAAFAIQSLHYISLLDVSTRINQFGKIIKKGGRGFLSFNLTRLIQQTEPHEWPKIFDLSQRLTIFDYYSYIKKELTKVDYKIIAADVLPDFEQMYSNLAGPDWPAIEKYADRDFSNVPELIRKEILQNADVFAFNIGLNDMMDGNIKIVFEV